ncbi:hypothetical protein BS50DRAFT_555590 [Corynespora cassiicola Philippines]|uniref:Uncharacterized protein n=1 Tax=Corynespora cassiicola Philippines TaxID=1448308 RepID=A0A2T2NJD8_CORCC|nr:hypothetical protein BS50DRAFT_555590 [Corynespora cassiicola Philippines]
MASIPLPTATSPDLSNVKPTPSKPSRRPPPPDRLGMTFDKRLLLAAFTSFGSGFTLGALSAGHMASMRFRAENAHRLPVSQPGWYLYHKSKNYNKAKVGVVEGVRKGAWVATWVSVFFVIEESIDVFRGTWRAGRTLEEMEGVDELEIERIERGVGKSRDWVSSTMAGMVTGGLWSAWNTFPMVTAARTIRLGLVVGLGYGLGQDALSWAKKRWGQPGGETSQGQSWIYKGARNDQVEEEGGQK